MSKTTVSHRERMEACLAGEQPDRVPVALWRHFPVDDQTPEGLAGAVLDYQQKFDFDLVKVTPASSYCLKDWGVNDAWQGATEGTRAYTQRVVSKPEDWLSLPVLDPHQGYLRANLEALKLITRALGPDTPVLATIFSPLAQAKNLAGGSTLLWHLRRYPEEVHRGLKTIMFSTSTFIEAAHETGISGIFYAVQHAQFGILSEAEFEEFEKVYDLKVLASAKGLFMNMLHLHGEMVMFDQVADYPVQVLNWHDRDTYPTLAEGLERVTGAVCGGLQREHTMVLGTPDQVKNEALDAIRATGGRRFILGTGCVTPIHAPRANLLAARQVVDS